MATAKKADFIDEKVIEKQLASGKSTSKKAVLEILAKARTLSGLDGNDVSSLMNIEDEELIAELHATAKYIKDTIYGRRLVIFAPLYISNLCKNECLYCAFRNENNKVRRRALSQEEIAAETVTLLKQGHKRVLVVAGEAYPAKDGFDYVLKSIDTVYKQRDGIASIRRINVNVAPLSVEQYKALHDAKIGTYQIFQETYHRATYGEVHLKGPKTDYDYRVTAFDRAMEAGIGDVGAGILFGLYDWKWEVLALWQHIAHLEKAFGVGPHTISVPRIEPAEGSDYASNPKYAVSDRDFKKLIAILRCAVPYTGIIMSTRETAEIRRETYALGISQISAGSKTNPGGYSEDGEGGSGEQFSLGDHRTLDEVIRDAASMGYLPSFCTACYRMGRTGADFMDLAKPGDIKMFCDPNACSSFTEYLEDYGSEETKKTGYALLEKITSEMQGDAQKRASGMVADVKGGKRDCFC
jgi:2-iminoacetate synthase